MHLFSAFAHTVAINFQAITLAPQVFVANIDGDDLWTRYLAAFPEGADPIFRKRTWHDCNCCKQFVRRAGTAVAIKDGQIRTVWDDAARYGGPGPYRAIATALRDAVASAGIRDIFRVHSSEPQFGAHKTHSLNAENGEAMTWEHFYTGQLPSNLRRPQPDTEKGEYRASVQVLTRGLVELAPDAVENVIGLIQSNNLYRGEEHLRAVEGFQALQREFRETPARDLFVWANAASPAARFRNTVIGTLVQDLSEGKDLETAVRAFETKVAPQNYKRTTAVITPMMVKKAMETIDALSLEPALERRFAVLSDVSVNDVLWVDGAARPLMKGGIGDVLMRHAAGAAPAPEGHAENINIEDLMSLLPSVQSMEVFFDGAHTGNLMALTAPVHPEPKQLFRWNNDFAWSYGGNVADSIKERVKKAGGKVQGALRVSLSWFNFDDLDLHVLEPQRPGRYLEEINYYNRHGWTGGNLDVDMNAGGGQTREAVENVIWTNIPPDGPYKVVVNNFCLRERSNPGFVIEVENAGRVTHFSYNKSINTAGDVVVATLHMKDGIIDRIDVDPGVTAANISQEMWGLQTERYVKVNTVMLSPNHWSGSAVGNKHTFFVLDGAKSDEEMRGFYNEFLHPRLEEHRKVFEVIADKTKCHPTEGHMAGLGFSSTKKDTFRVRVQQGGKRRTFNVQVG